MIPNRDKDGWYWAGVVIGGVIFFGVIASVLGAGLWIAIRIINHFNL